MGDLVFQGQGMTQAVPKQDLKRQENNVQMGRETSRGVADKPGACFKERQAGKEKTR